jgi:acyl-CoA thioester hydrolase
MKTETLLTVRYAETDKMGIVHHAVYPIWFEAARTDFLNQAGMSYDKMETDGFFLPLIDLSCHYNKPAHYGEDVIVKTEITRMEYVKVVFSYVVNRAGDQLLLADGSTTHVWVNRLLKPINMAKKAPELFNAINNLCSCKE